MVYREGLPFSPEPQKEERQLLHSLVAEALFWMNPKNPRALKGDSAIYRSLDNHHIYEKASRDQWIAKIKTEFRRIREEQQDLEDVERAILEEDARRHEKEINPDHDFSEI